MFNNMKLWNEKRQLQSKLTTIIDLMAGWKEQDLPAGHKYYAKLWHDAQVAIEHFMDESYRLAKTKPTFDEIVVGVPTLRELESLALGIQAESRSSQVVGIAIGVIIAGFAGTVYLALCHATYLGLTHLLIRFH